MNQAACQVIPEFAFSNIGTNSSSDSGLIGASQYRLPGDCDTADSRALAFNEGLASLLLAVNEYAEGLTANDTFNPSGEALSLAATFAVSLVEIGGSMPEVTMERDEEFSFEWYEDPTHLMKVVVTPDSLYWAGMNGRRNRFKGSAAFPSSIPKEVVDAILRLNSLR